jgi:hypothetical protein
MKTRIQRARWWGIFDPHKPLIICLDGSRRHRVVQVHRRNSLAKKIQREITGVLSVCDGLIETNIPRLTNAR